MVYIKNWKKSGKYNKRGHTIYYNTLPKYEKFHNNFHVSVGKVGRTSDFFVQITKEGKATAKEFPNWKTALSYAIKYMKKHPRG